MRLAPIICALALLPGSLLAQVPSGSIAVASVNGQPANPATGAVALPLFYDTSIIMATPATGGTVVMAQTTGTEIINPAGLLLAATLQLPTCSSTYNGQFARFSSTQVITALSVTATGGSVASAGLLTGLTAGGFGIYTCYGATSTWYRVG